MSGLILDLWVDYDDRKIEVSFEELGILEADFLKMSSMERCEAVSCYVKNMKEQPKWIIDDFSLFKRTQ